MVLCFLNSWPAFSYNKHQSTLVTFLKEDKHCFLVATYFFLSYPPVHQHSNFLTLASSIFIVRHLGRNAMLSDAFRVEILDGDLDGLAVGDHVVLEAWHFFPGVFAKFVSSCHNYSTVD